MKRRAVLRSIAAVSAAGFAAAPWTSAAVPRMKITRVRAYLPPQPNPIFNQSNIVVAVETDAGITGIGEGGSRDMLEQCAGRLIGQDPSRTEHLWQDMYRAFFYPPGREKVHALGALDMALWDIRGKALSAPVHALLGGMARNHMECYYTGNGFPGSIKERARATMEAGFRAFRMDAASLREGTTYNTHERVNQLYEDCAQAREGVGKNGDWCIDFHTRFDLSDAVRAAHLIEDLAPYFVEDPVRSEGFHDLLPAFRTQVKVPVAAGEQWGSRWDFHKLIEHNTIDFVRCTLPNVGGITEWTKVAALCETNLQEPLTAFRKQVEVAVAAGEQGGSRWDFHKLIEHNTIDYVRCTLPNVGGITEWTKVAALCETHFIGLIPHFTGPISTAALVHACGPFSGPVLFEFTGRTGAWDYLPQCLTFNNGKIWPNERPGLGVEVDFKRLKMIAEFTEPITNRVVYRSEEHTSELQSRLHLVCRL